MTAQDLLRGGQSRAQVRDSDAGRDLRDGGGADFQTPSFPEFLGFQLNRDFSGEG